VPCVSTIVVVSLELTSDILRESRGMSCTSAEGLSMQCSSETRYYLQSCGEGHERINIRAAAKKSSSHMQER